jgi:hypothetical protein
MTSRHIAQSRLHNQYLNRPWTDGPGELVRWMGCIQAQDFAAGKWALGLRMPGTTEAELDRCLDEGTFLRTHILRPTWHFVSPADVAWMLRLTAPRVNMFCKGWHRRLGIKPATLRRSKNILVKALEGKKHLTRTALAALFRAAKINTDDIRMTFYLMDAELEGLICSGPRQGKQFTYALLSERAPHNRLLDAGEALQELAYRYFSSRGPATVQDFAWWSGLTLASARRGVELNASRLSHLVHRGQAYLFSVEPTAALKPTVHLLPSYDEYTVAYKDRSDVLAPEYNTLTGSGIFRPTLLVDGAVKGIWKRIDNKDSVHVEVRSPIPVKTRLLERAAERYGAFLQLSNKRVFGPLVRV